MDRLGLRGKEEKKDHQVRKGNQVRKESQVFLVHLETEVNHPTTSSLRDHQDLQDHRVPRAPQDLQALRVPLESGTTELIFRLQVRYTPFQMMTRPLQRRS